MKKTSKPQKSAKEKTAWPTGTPIAKIEVETTPSKHQDFATILQILHAPCGDMLKLLIINSATQANLNPIYLRNPTGEVEEAFATAMAQAKASEASQAARSILKEFQSSIPTADHLKHPISLSENTSKIPSKNETYPEGEMLINGKVYVTPLKAAYLLGYKLKQDAYRIANIKKWLSIKEPFGAGRVYLKEDVLRDPPKRRTTKNGRTASEVALGYR